MNKIFNRDALVYYVAGLLSLLLSIWIVLRESVINPDAICYLSSAEIFGKSGLHAAMNFCPQARWPFYSILIYATGSLTHLSFTNAAYALDALFTLITVLSFIAIVKTLGGEKRVLWLAALTILTAHEFNSVRMDIVRDHGFWAFYSLSILFLLRFMKQTHWFDALLWSVSLIVATLFRLEGIFFLLLLPFITFFKSDQSIAKRSREFLLLNMPLMITCLMISAWLVGHQDQSLKTFGRVTEVIFQLQHGWQLALNQFVHTSTLIAHTLLTNASASDASLVSIVLFTSWYLINVVCNVSLIYLLLFLYAWRSRALPLAQSAFVVLCGYLVVNLLTTSSFFAENLFLAKRYLIALSLVLMLWVPFALDKMMQMKKHRFIYLSSFFILISAVGGFFQFGHSKNYIYQAGNWLASNVPANATLYSNNLQLMYYSKHYGESLYQQASQQRDVTMLAGGRFKQYDYVAFNVKNKNKFEINKIILEMKLQPIQVFSNQQGGSVQIYQINPSIKEHVA